MLAWVVIFVKRICAILCKKNQTRVPVNANLSAPTAWSYYANRSAQELATGSRFHQASLSTISKHRRSAISNDVLLTKQYECSMQVPSQASRSSIIVIPLSHPTTTR